MHPPPAVLPVQPEPPRAGWEQRCSSVPARLEIRFEGNSWDLGYKKRCLNFSALRVLPWEWQAEGCGSPLKAARVGLSKSQM